MLNWNLKNPTMRRKDSHKKPVELAIEPLAAPIPNYPEMARMILKSIEDAIRQSAAQDLPVIA